jgi:hypothetical protein
MGPCGSVSISSSIGGAGLPCVLAHAAPSLPLAKRMLNLNSLQVVFAQILPLGERPRQKLNGLRRQWKSVFNKKCFSLNPDAVVLRQYSTIKPSYSLLPWVPDLGQIRMNPARAVLLRDRDRRNAFREKMLFYDHFSNAPTTKPEETLSIEQEGGDEGTWWDERTWWDDTYFGNMTAHMFGVDLSVSDQRMNHVFYELSQPLFVTAETGSALRVQGRIYVHIFPAGYVAIFVALTAHASEGQTVSIQDMAREMQVGQVGKWIWSSKIANGSLRDIVFQVKSRVLHSIFQDRPSRFEETPWARYVRVQVGNASKEQVASALLGDEAPYVSINVPGYRATWEKKKDTLIISGRHFIMLDRTPSRHKLRGFWRIIYIAEFLAIKNRMYDEYASFLRTEIRTLEKYRLRPSRKLTQEGITRLEIYDESIAEHLALLDAYINIASPVNRKIYAIFSTQSGFDGRREAVKRLVQQWADEVSKWSPPLYVAWAKLLSPLRALFSG